jgi:hypothetical protein
MQPQEEFDAELLNTLSAAGGWLKRGIAQYLPLIKTLPGDGNEAIFRANYKLDLAVRMLQNRMLERKNG